MRTFPLLSALALILSQASCAVVQAPFKMANGMLNAVGRSLHLSSENTMKPGEFNVESRDSKQAVVLNSAEAPDLKPDLGGSLLAQR